MRVLLVTACIIVGGISSAFACEQGDQKCGPDGYVMRCNCVLKYNRSDNDNCAWITSMRHCSSVDQKDSVPEPSHLLRVRLFGFDPVATPGR